MKRKLNQDDVPEAVPPGVETVQPPIKANATFSDFNLDARLLQAITREKFTKPTPVQAQAIPLAIGGKDVLGTYGGNITFHS